MSKETRKQLASLPFSEKLKILAKLRDRSLAIGASGLRARKADPPASVKPRTGHG